MKQILKNMLLGMKIRQKQLCNKNEVLDVTEKEKCIITYLKTEEFTEREKILIESLIYDSIWESTRQIKSSIKVNRVELIGLRGKFEKMLKSIKEDIKNVYNLEYRSILSILLKNRVGELEKIKYPEDADFDDKGLYNLRDEYVMLFFKIFPVENTKKKRSR